MMRHLLIAAIFLLSGAFVNVAVAWLCALTSFTARTESAVASDYSTIWRVDRISRTGAVVFVSVRALSPGVDPTGEVFFSRVPARSPGVVRTGVGGGPAELLDDWTGFASPTAEFESGETPRETRAATGRGLPMLALWCETTRRGEGQVRGGIDTGALPLNHWLRKTPAGRLLVNPRVLPLRPLWPGFAVNTLVFAAILWFLICGPFALRRHIRMKRGRCGKCGYPKGRSDICSECGKASPDHVGA